MSKEKKGNREVKKKSDGTKKEKKDPNRHDSPIANVLKNSNKKQKT